VKVTMHGEVRKRSDLQKKVDFVTPTSKDHNIWIHVSSYMLNGHTVGHTIALHVHPPLLMPGRGHLSWCNRVHPPLVNLRPPLTTQPFRPFLPPIVDTKPKCSYKSIRRATLEIVVPGPVKQAAHSTIMLLRSSHRLLELPSGRGHQESWAVLRSRPQRHLQSQAVYALYRCQRT
jgi:hypothetical protein